MTKVVCSYVVLALAVNYALGTFDVDSFSYHSRNLASAIVYPLLTLFLFYGYRVTKFSGIFAIAKIVSSGKKRRAKEIEGLIASQIFKFANSTITQVVLLAIALTVAVSYYLHIHNEIPINSSFFILALQAFPIWLLILLILRNINITYISLRSHFKKSQRLQLFEVERLNSINEFVFTIIGVYCGAIAIYSISAIFVALLLSEIVALLVGFLMCLGLIVLPAKTLIKKLKIEKEEELQMINQEIAFHLKSGNQQIKKNRLVDDTNKLSYISDLLVVRKNIAETPIIPLKMPTFARLILLLILPFVSWFAAGTVSNLLKLVG